LTPTRPFLFILVFELSGVIIIAIVLINLRDNYKINDTMIILSNKIITYIN